ncbi:MAG: sigma-E processing peptidase SpoIIGA [Anaeroplasma sp.]
MFMKYIEIIVLINLVIHILIVKICNYLFNQKAFLIGNIISCSLDIIYVTLYLLIPEKIEYFKYLFIIVISFLPFINKGIFKALLSTLIYLLLNFCLGGISEFVYQIVNNFLSVVISLSLIIVIMIILMFYKRFNFNNSSLIYKIVINDNGMEYTLSGYCDTGNFMYADDNVPIVFINKKFKLGKYKKDIIIKTVSTSKKLRIYQVDKFFIYNNGRYIKKDVYIAYGDIAFDLMFGLNILGGP